MVKYSHTHFILIAIDQLCNAILKGNPDETLSARCWRKRTIQPWKSLRLGLDFIFFWQKEHCKLAWHDEMQRLQLPAIYKNSGKKS